MKPKLAGLLLVAILLIGACATAVLSVKFFFGVKELQTIQTQMLRITATLNAAQALANECVEYSRRNPAINPILFQFEVKKGPAAETAQPGMPAPPATPR